MTTTDPILTTTVNGQQVPLTDCCWVQSAPCGCVVTVRVAAVPGGPVLTTAEQAHERIVPLKRERARDIECGLTFELMSLDRYRTTVGTHWKCAKHTPAPLPA